MSKVYDNLVNATFAYLLVVIWKHKDSPIMKSHLALLDENNVAVLEEYKYGLKAIYMNAWKTLILIVLALIFGIWRQVVLFAIAYVGLRLFSHGLHLKSSIACTLLGLTYYMGVSSLAVAITIPAYLQVGLWIICFILCLLYAPAATKKRPIFPREKRIKKIASLIVLAVLASASYILAINGKGEIANILLAGVFCQTLNVLPISYKILRSDKP
jgi:accessory gene regulator B